MAWGWLPHPRQLSVWIFFCFLTYLSLESQSLVPVVQGHLGRWDKPGPGSPVIPSRNLFPFHLVFQAPSSSWLWEGKGSTATCWVCLSFLCCRVVSSTNWFSFHTPWCFLIFLSPPFAVPQDRADCQSVHITCMSSLYLCQAQAFPAARDLDVCMGAWSGSPQCFWQCLSARWRPWPVYFHWEGEEC